MRRAHRPEHGHSCELEKRRRLTHEIMPADHDRSQLNHSCGNRGNTGIGSARKMNLAHLRHRKPPHFGGCSSQKKRPLSRREGELRRRSGPGGITWA
jgi:hypothetical protein